VHCFTSAVGDPVLCAVILKSTKDIQDIPLNWKLGIDVRKEVLTGETTVETFEQNYGENKACAGGPSCYYNGIKIPCFVGSSPKASITSKMLMEMLKLLDDLNVYDRSNGKLPVLILDGHHSRMKLPFLKYINDSDHQWSVCLGVPYGTHIWQVADSSELNGNFKIALTKAKAEYLQHKETINQKFVPTDIIPLLNMAWEGTFNRVDTARRAVLERGWNPLNYVLLDHPGIRRFDETPDDTTVDNSNNDCGNQPSVCVTESQDSSRILFEINNENNNRAMSKMLDKLIEIRND
jgi:hypothetical protein